MPSTTESLVIAADALQAAVDKVLALNTATLAAQAATIQGAATTVQQATPLSRTWYVDPVNGSDNAAGRDGSGRGKEFRTIEAVLALAAPATKHLVLLLGDTEVTKRVGQYADVSIVGAAYSDATTSTTVNTQRRVSTRPEATNSPLVGAFAGRHTAGFFLYSCQLSFTNIDIVLPDVPAGIVSPAALIGSGYSSVTAQNCTLNGTTAGNAGRFVSNGDSTPIRVYLGATIGAAMAGRIFGGIAAGADPNAGKRYDTNLTAN